MLKIFKYLIARMNVPSIVRDDIVLPIGARILSVAEQYDDIIVYAMVNPQTNANATKKVEIRIVGTGHEITFNTMEFRFLGTVKVMNGQLMFHIFYRDPEVTEVVLCR